MEYAAGRKLDYLVAEHVMDIYQQGAMIILPNGEKVRRYVWVETETGGQHIDNADECVPCYSTDIAAAWQVVEKFTEGDGLGYFFIERVQNKSQGWDEGWVASADDFDTQVEADTAPLAICLAALKAVGYHERHTT